jgi:hypothetical protein
MTKANINKSIRMLSPFIRVDLADCPRIEESHRFIGKYQWVSSISGKLNEKLFFKSVSCFSSVGKK